MLTRSEAPLVDPAVDLCALLLQLLDPGLHVGKLALELLNLLSVGTDGLVESLGQQIGHGFWLACIQARCRLAEARYAVGHGSSILRLLLARIHVLIGGRRQGARLLLLVLLRLGVRRFGPLLVVVVGLGALGGVVFNVAVCARAALEEHGEEKEKEGGEEGVGRRWAI